MLKELKSNHYTISPKITDRFEKDQGITSSVLKSRGTAFEILEGLSPKLSNPKLISSAYGSINRLLLTIPSDVFLGSDSRAYMDAYTDLVGKLPESTELIILTNESAEPACRAWLDENGITEKTELGLAPDYLNFSIWAEDAYCMSEDVDTGKTFFIESASFDRYDDEYIADEVSKFTDLELSLASLYFQGGNVLIGDDFWLIGLDYPNNSFAKGYIRQEPGESKLEATRRAYGLHMDQHRMLYPIGTHLPVPAEAYIPQEFNGEEWHHVIYRGNREGTTQPLFHIDMFITLLGKSAEGKNLAMVADPSLAEEVLLGVEELSDDMKNIIEFSKQFSMQSVFNDIAKRLVELDFEVVRNPLPSAYRLKPSKKQIQWYFATANNALVQTTGDTKQIWIPQYGFGSWEELSHTDAKNIEILKNLEFEVNGLTDFHPFAGSLGAVHCISKYIARS